MKNTRFFMIITREITIKITEINPIIKIHRKPGLLEISAGTPLCQLIFLKNEICDVEIE